MLRDQKKNLIRTQQGFTFAEIMVALAIFVLITGGAYTLALTSQGHWDTNRVVIQLHQELRKASDWMVSDLRQAGPGAIFTVPADGTLYSSISFKKGASISSGALVWENDAIQYARGGTGSSQIIRTQGGNSKVLANKISGLTFRRQPTSPDILEITIQGADTTERGRSASYQLSFEIELRN